MSTSVLVAHGDPLERDELRGRLRALGFDAISAGALRPAVRSAREDRAAVVLLDLALDPDCRELGAFGDVPVLVTGTSIDVRTAVDAMRRGAADVLERPLETDLLRSAVDRALSRRDSREASAPRPFAEDAIVGTAPVLRRMLEQVAKIASTDSSTVLVQGESGTGKELVARSIHARSRRAPAPFVALNCAALNETLVEAELFGYEPGAFTGADKQGRRGLIASAEGGTLFLDEIGELPEPMQAKLLRVLQERTYRRVGGDGDLAMDVRVVASTHRDLQAMVAEGTFREDLFYRLNVLSVRVPALRDRPEDIPALAAHFMESFGQEPGREGPHLTPEAIQALTLHSWPGNVRELRNTLERGALLSKGETVDAEDLGLESASSGILTPQAPPADSLPLGDRSLKCVEQALIKRVLEEASGNRSRAARVLGVNRATLYNKLRAYGLEAS